jgi:hypothetical protein
MIQDLATETGATVLVIASMLLFLGAFLAIAISTWRKSRTVMDARARMPLEDDGIVPSAPLGQGEHH